MPALLLQIKNLKSRGPFVLVLLVCQATLWGQTQLSTLRGTVTDPSGAVMPGVSVVAEEMATKITARTVITDNQGNYEIPDIKAGTYRLRVTMPGFKGFTASDIVLESNQIKRVDVQLQIGEASSEVTVNEAARVIETEDSKLSAEFTGEQYKFAPLPGTSSPENNTSSLRCRAMHTPLRFRWSRRCRTFTSPPAVSFASQWRARSRTRWVWTALRRKTPTLRR